MADLSGSRAPRDDGADDQSLADQFRSWLRNVLRGRESLRDTIEELIEEEDGEPEASLAADERHLLSNILELRDRSAADVMVPRVDIVAVEVGTDLPTLLRQVADKPHSRMPVYRETLDDIVGMVHIKDILRAIAAGTPFDLATIVRDMPVVAPSQSVLDLLKDMRQTRRHMALVVDEFGGIDGLVTIEDLVEEIVGEIEDEHDRDEEPVVIQRPDGSLIADARLTLEDFEERYGEAFSEDEREDLDTLGGVVFNLAGRIPTRGEHFEHPSGLQFEVLDADPRRVKRLRVRNLPQPESPSADE